MHLQPTNQKAAGEFLHGILWADLKRCLLARRPVKPDAKDDIHVAAAKGHARAGFESAIEAIETLPFEFPAEQASPFARPAVAITED